MDGRSNEESGSYPVSRFECVSGLSVYPVEIRSVNHLSSREDCSTDYCQPV